MDDDDEGSAEGELRSADEEAGREDTAVELFLMSEIEEALRVHFAFEE